MSLPEPRSNLLRYEAVLLHHLAFNLHLGEVGEDVIPFTKIDKRVDDAAIGEFVVPRAEIDQAYTTTEIDDPCHRPGVGEAVVAVTRIETPARFRC